MANKKKEAIERLQKKIKNKESEEKKRLLALFATREKLERDYKEDIICVTFQTSPTTKRTIEARKPTHSEMITILRLLSEVASISGKEISPKVAKNLTEAFEELPKLAAELTTDPSLDEDFWKNKISFQALINFITSLMEESNKPPISKEELENFR